MDFIFVLQERLLNVNSVPSWLDYQDGFYFSDDLAEMPEDVSSFSRDGEIDDRLIFEYLLDQGYEGVSESFEVRHAFRFFAEAEVFAKKTNYRYPMGYQIIPIQFTKTNSTKNV